MCIVNTVQKNSIWRIAGSGYCFGRCRVGSVHLPEYPRLNAVPVPEPVAVLPGFALGT